MWWERLIEAFHYSRIYLSLDHVSAEYMLSYFNIPYLDG